MTINGNGAAKKAANGNGAAAQGQRRAARRRLARRLHLGRARPAAGGRAARTGRGLRHQRRRHERGCAGRRLGARRRRRRARAACRILESGRPQGPLQPGAAHALGHAARQLVDRQLARLFCVRRHVAGVLALCGQPVQLQSAARGGRAARSASTTSARGRASSCSSRPPMSRPASSGCSRTTRSTPTSSWRRPACRIIFQAVTIDGVPYWDGGYGGNPAIYPFFYANEVEDVLLVQVNPVMREGHAAFGRRRSRTASTRSPSTPRCSANSGRSASSRS